MEIPSALEANGSNMIIKRNEITIFFISKIFIWILSFEFWILSRKLSGLNFGL
jgi:hypothetical protein